MKQLSKSSSTLLFIVLTGLLLVVAFISYSKISQYSKSVDAVIHTNLVKSKIVEVVSNLKDANSGQRGYLLTNDTIFLQPFKEAEQRLDFLFVSIDSILSDNPMQQLHLKRLKSLVADSYLLMNKSLKLSKNNIPDSLINSALFTGKNKMDEVVKQISILLNEEDELLLQRTQIKDRSATFTPVFLLLLSLFSIFVITLFFFRLQKETSARVSTERLMEVQAEARKKIEAGEKRLSKIVHQSPFAFAILKGKDMVITLANDAIKEIWGKGKEVEGKPLFDLLPELKDSVFPKLFDDVYTTGTPHLENEILAKLEHNGVLKDMYFNLVYQPFHDANNAILGVTIIAVEVTTQVLAKRQIEESETKFRTLSETLRNMIWTAAPDGKKNFFNQYFLDYTGLSFEELIDDGILKIIFPDDLERDLQHWHHALKTGNEFKIEKRIRHRDGTYRWHLSHGIAQKDMHGNIIGWIGSSTEIEDQKKFADQLEAEVKERTKELQLQNQTFEIAEKIAKFGSYRWNISTGVLEYSDNLYRLFDCEPQEFVPSFEKFLSFVHPDDLEQVMNNREQTMQTGVLIETPYRIISKTGTIKYLRSSGNFSGKGVYRLLIGTVQDISTDVAASKELKIKNIELENANAELSSFSYVASHDLQEPLRKIQGFSKRILDKDGEKLSDTTRDYFNRIHAAAQRMQNLIESLLSFSRTNTTEIVFEKTDLNQILNEVKATLQDTIKEKNAVIESEILPTLNTVPVQMQQLFINLIGNALKYSKHNVTPLIKITVEKVTINEIAGRIKQNGDFWKISFNDNGIGFEQEYENKIFELFQRLHGKTEYEGTGIGLAICKKIVQSHNGIITAKGQPGIGSIFTIFLSDSNKS
ncbi:MAG: PAS domain-containing protein [Saprospiraceae bacterium]